MAHKPNKVLVVDDSLVINKILTESINNDLHLDVVSAFDMKGAIKAIAENPEQFFAAVLDLNLPDAADGQIVQAMITLGLRPIILTATMSDDLHDEMMSKPIVDYVIKRNLTEMQYVIDLVGRLYDNFDRNILIVDDSRVSRNLIRSLLERHNYSVVDVATVEEGFEQLSNGPKFDLIIVDYNMPTMPGFEFISKVRSDFQRQELAVIGISTVGSGTVSVQMLKAGANDFISRPFMHEEFYCRVNQNIDAISSFRRLNEQAFSDSLTGLYNRRYMFEAGRKLYENAKRDNLTIAVAMLDIDYFKKLNEEHGHKVGDLALKHLAELFKKHFREADIIARLGGEEFCIMCLNVDEGSVVQIFERFRNRVMATPMRANGRTIAFTVSIGFTLDLSSTFEAMVGIADHQLYQAKNQGRNQVKG